MQKEVVDRDCTIIFDQSLFENQTLYADILNVANDPFKPVDRVRTFLIKYLEYNQLCDMCKDWYLHWSEIQRQTRKAYFLQFEMSVLHR